MHASYQDPALQVGTGCQGSVVVGEFSSCVSFRRMSKLFFVFLLIKEAAPGSDQWTLINSEAKLDPSNAHVHRF